MIISGTYKIDNVAPGMHKVKIVSFYNGMLSDDAEYDVEVKDPSLQKYVKSTRNFTLGATVSVSNIERQHQEGNRRAATLVDGVISYDTWNVVETTWGNKDAVINIELAQAYDKKSIDEIMMSFKSDITNATDYKVEFSADGEKYETVLQKSGVPYKSVLEDKLDLSGYKGDSVSYVRVTLSGGNYTYGYQISEIALMGTDEYNPPETTTREIVTRERPTTGRNDDESEETIDNKESTNNDQTTKSSKDETDESKESTKDVSEETTGDFVTSNISGESTNSPTGSVQNPTTDSKDFGTKEKRVGQTKVKKATKKKSAKKISIKLKKVKGAKGYQIAIYKTKKAKKAKKAILMKYVKKATSKMKHNKLKKMKKIFVSARAYIIENKKKEFGKWSARVRVKVRK